MPRAVPQLAAMKAPRFCGQWVVATWSKIVRMLEKQQQSDTKVDKANM